MQHDTDLLTQNCRIWPQENFNLTKTTQLLAQRMSETREFDFIPLKRAARYLVGKPKAALRFRRQEHVYKIKVFGTQSREKARRHTVKSGSTLQSLTALSVGEAEFYAVVKASEFIYVDPGIQMKAEINSDRSTSNSLTDRLGAGPRTKHMHTTFWGVQGRVKFQPRKIV